MKPSVLLPILGGLLAGGASMLMGGNPVLTGVAIAGLGGGVAWMLASLFWNVEHLTDQALAAERRANREQENRRLDELASQLRRDRDHRTQDSLILLRSLRDEFETASELPGWQQRSATFGAQMGQVFRAAIERLRDSYRLASQAENLVGEMRQKVLDERERIIAEVQNSIEHLRDVVRQFRELVHSGQAGDLSDLQHELDTSLEVAKRTEERLRELEAPPTRHESFLQE